MFDCDQALDILVRAVAEYRPAAAIHDLVWQRDRSDHPALARRAANAH